MGGGSASRARRRGQPLLVHRALSSRPAAAKAAKDLAGVHALVVDAIPVTRAITQRQLASLEVRVTGAESGGKHSHSVQGPADGGDPYRLVLADLSTPGIDGLELARICVHARSSARPGPDPRGGPVTPRAGRLGVETASSARRPQVAELACARGCSPRATSARTAPAPAHARRSLRRRCSARRGWRPDQAGGAAAAGRRQAGTWTSRRTAVTRYPAQRGATTTRS